MPRSRDNQPNSNPSTKHVLIVLAVFAYMIYAFTIHMQK